MNTQLKNAVPDNVTPALKSITSMQQTHMGAGVTIQSYAISILTQAHVQLQNFPNLKDEEDKINNALDGAKAHAKDYLDHLQVKILTSLSAMQEYISVHKSSTGFLTGNMSLQDFLDVLNNLKDTTSGYSKIAGDVVADLTSFRDNLTTDATAFATLVNDFHSKTGGDVDQLKNITTQITELQHRITIDIALAAASGLGILAGGVLIFVGAATEVFTAGASTVAVVGGIGLVAAGIGGEAASGADLAALIKQKADLVNQQVALQDEIKTTQTLVAGYTGLAQHSQLAFTAAQDMANTWELLGAALGELVTMVTSDLGQAETAKAIIIKIMKGAVLDEIDVLSKNIDLITEQFAGVHQKVKAIYNQKGNLLVRAYNDPRTSTPQLHVDPNKTVYNMLVG
ncbi:HBL/NHE enterotoxin family protein [Pseudomonas sp. P2757]|uniref:HBL/NHE enterotoxin family protein n=1 Tax=unclassified Pseudomonas TaxID=196821 RepID=UPI003B5A2A66